MSIRATIIRIALRMFKGAMLSSLDPIKIRSKINKITKYAPEPPAFVRYENQTINKLPCKWAIPEQADSQRVILYFHGGGFIMGSSDTTHKDFLWRLAASANIRVLAVDYRLAPEHAYPAQLEDCISIYDWLLENDYQPQHIAFAGDSAGGNLVFATALKVRDTNKPMPAALVGLSPWADMTASGDSALSNADKDQILPGREGLIEGASFYLQGHDPKDPYVSPVFAAMHRMPTTLIHVGSEEVLLDDSRRLAADLRQAGVEVQLDIWKKMPHVWHAMARVIPEGKQAIEKLGEFLARELYR